MSMSKAWRMRFIVDILFFFLNCNQCIGSGVVKVEGRKSGDRVDRKSRHTWRGRGNKHIGFLRICLTAVTGLDPPIGSQQQSPIYATDSDTNGKINIHVSVVFVKSLSDLKKQRAQNRHISGGSLDANGNGIPMPVSSISNSDLSADDFTQRFTGNTSEIVGDNHTEKNCCAVM